MFSTVLDCRQSLSEVSLCSSTWLRGHRLGCTAFVRQGSKDVNWFQTSCRKALIDIEVIPDHQGLTKLKLVFCWDYVIFSLLNVCFISRWPVVIILKWRLTLLLKLGLRLA